VIGEDKNWVPSKFAGLSTGFKMLLILSLGLFPLALIAILASIDNARENRFDRNEEIRALVALSGQRLNSAISRSGLLIDAASAAMATTPNDSAICVNALERLNRVQTIRGSYALYDASGRRRCASNGIASPAAAAELGPLRPGLSLALDDRALRFRLADDDGRLAGIGEYRREALAGIGAVRSPNRATELSLILGNSRMILQQSGDPSFASQLIHEVAIAGQAQLRLRAGPVPVTAAEILGVLLPILMWISAAMIGWLIIDRLLLRPLVGMQRAVSAYRPGDRHLDMPVLVTPAREIGELGDAFDQVTKTVARHEADLEAAVDRQTRLVREVHHRVKNNLQVVASLLNLHSRGSRNEDVAAAYASIQRRVDALAVVHRNHYAELEEYRGVALKPLISELGANLRATAPPKAAHMSISLNIEPHNVTQDVAVSVAFLITEIVEYAMFCGGRAVRIALSGDNGSSARLAIESDGLQEGTAADPDLFARFDRIVTGLARQLRSAVDRDLASGCYSVSISVVERAERPRA
jgi:two-component sensor histidine kinase